MSQSMSQLPADVKVLGTPAKSNRKARLRVPAELRHRMIAEAAYYLAEKRAFQGGDPVNDWLDAERIIDQALLTGIKPRRALQFLAAA